MIRRSFPDSTFLSGLGCIVIFAAIACRSDKSPARDSSMGASTSAAVTASTKPNEPTCYAAELWSPCLLKKRLENAGLAPVEKDSVEHEFLHVKGLHWQLGRSELQTFIYPTAEALQHDLAGFDTLRAQPRSGSRVDWGGPPTVLVSRNLLAVFASLNERQVERVSDAITAGLLPLRSR